MIRSFIFFLSCSIILGCSKTEFTQREVISLNGEWDIGESLENNELPTGYDQQVQVPGLVDMATTGFDSVGFKYSKRNYFYYHRLFSVPEPLPPLVILKINKAVYGTRVFINGREVGYNPFCFTPSLFTVRDFLKPGTDNEIVVQVGAYLDNVPDSVHSGHDFEKIRYIAGIFDDVELILSDYPFIENIQIVPDIKNQQIRVVAEVLSETDLDDFRLDYEVHEDKTGKIINRGKSPPLKLKKDKNSYDFTIPLGNCHLWSPEDPFLYALNLSTGKDSKRERFGMRSFRFDKEKKRAILNDKPYRMLGTNVCIYRFFEDPLRNDLPWNEEWVRKLHNRFKEMNWNCIRYCIGFPPEMWYDIADETGLLIQDEYPIWGGDPKAEVLVQEYTRWMRERWNHPCVVIWDAQNENTTSQTGIAINRVRELDLSNRPWDNGFAPPQSEDDPIESHPYLFIRYCGKWEGYDRDSTVEGGYMKDLFDTIRIPDNDPNERSPLPEGRYNNPVIINEYAWLWINRDGSPTTLTDGVYKGLFGDNLSTDQRRRLYAEHLGVMTEYWRCHRSSAAIMHFCGLGYSRPDPPRGQTSDNFIDIVNLEYEPIFYKLIKPKFAPLCIMIDKWEKEYAPGSLLNVPVYVINDLPDEWTGPLSLSIMDANGSVAAVNKEITVKDSGRNIETFEISIPDHAGKYELVSELVHMSDTIRSIREFRVRE
jgi:hypothetical protein